MRTHTDWLKFCVSAGAAALGERRFLNCVWELTYRCNARCTICSYWKDPSDRAAEMTLSDIETGLRKVSAYGCRLVNFTGGEPTLRPDLESIVEAASRLGMWTSMVTNGSLLTRDRLHDLKDAGLDSLMVSLDSPDPRVHDRQRGLSGAHAKVLQCLEWLAEDFLSGHRTGGFMTVISAHNIADLPALVKLADRLGVYILVQPYHSNKTGNASLAPHLSSHAVRALLAMKRHSRVILNSEAYLRGFGSFGKPEEEETGRMSTRPACQAGHKYFSVDPYGYLHPCVDLPAAGHLLRDPIAAIASEQARNAIDSCAGCWYCFRGEADSTLSPGGCAEKAALGMTILCRNTVLRAGRAAAFRAAAAV
jgi:MoaA/NifB/PqqE/SkfB family radical SAM enzyme